MLRGTASLSTTATSASGVGSYAITVGLGTLSTTNYTFDFANGTFTVTPATLTVTADNKTMVYGASRARVDRHDRRLCQRRYHRAWSRGTASLSTTATSASGVGSYTITVGPGSLSAKNYNFAFANGTLSVTPATLTVTASNKTMVYGTSLPALTDTIGGFVNGDPSSVVTGTANLSTTAISASGVGSYTITVGLGSLSARRIIPSPSPAVR